MVKPIDHDRIGRSSNALGPFPFGDSLGVALHILHADLHLQIN